MAIYPCAIGNHRYAGPQQSLYVTVLNGSTPASTKLRLCSPHFLDILSVVQDEMDNVSDGGQMSSLCQKCGATRDMSVFARVFPLHEEEATFALDLCVPCATQLADRLHTRSGTPLPGR